MEGTFYALTVTGISAVLSRTSHDMTPAIPFHTTHTHHFVYVERGTVLFQRPQQKDVAVTSVLLIPKDTTYRLLGEGNCKLWDIAFDCKETTSKEIFTSDLMFSSMARHCAVMERIFREKEDCWQYQLYEEFYHVLHTLGKNYLGTAHASDPLAYEAQSYLHAHFAEHDCKIEDAAAFCHVTRQHLRNVFLARFEVSPMQYLNQLRISRAKELLCVTSLPLDEVAVQSGFCDQSTFTKAFKEKVGVTPRVFRSTYSV